MYEYHESAKQHGFKITSIGFIIMSICLAFVLMMSSGGVVFAGILFIPIIALSLGALCGLFILGTGIIQIIRGGDFKITASNKGISWQIPKYVGESFQYRLADISCIKKITSVRKKKSGEIKTKTKYVLAAKNGEEHKLLKQSNVSIEDLVDSLFKSGIELRESTS